MRKHIQVYETTCIRCGKTIYTANRSIYGLDDLKARLGRVCEACCTPEENHEIQEAMAEVLLRSKPC